MGQRFEGKNVDEALEQAAETLGVPRHQLNYHVLVEKRGFFGGTKRVVVEAEVNEAAAVAAAPPPPAAAPPVPGSRADRPARAPRGGGGGGGRGGRGGRGRGDRGGGGGGGRGPRRPRRYDDDLDALQPGDFERFATEAPEQGEESESAAAVHGWCSRVFELSKLEIDPRTSENETQIIVKLYGRDARRLTEEHGELLDALQVLANKALVGRKTEKDIELDCETFKEQRTLDLQQRARDLADRVRTDGLEQLLPAMTPIERRIVHLTLHDDAEVTTESRGEGFYKRVAIVRKDNGPAS
jgi:spoIIIJ-associated protein